MERGRKTGPGFAEILNFLEICKNPGISQNLRIFVNFRNFWNFCTFAKMGIWRAPHPPPYLKSRALRGGFLKSWASQGRILYPKPWILQGGFLEKLSGIRGGGILFPPLVPASLLSRTLSSHNPLHPWIRIQCHLRCRKLHLVALKLVAINNGFPIPSDRGPKFPNPSNENLFVGGFWWGSTN